LHISVVSISIFTSFKDLNSLLAGDRLEDHKFFRTDADRTVMRSKLVQQCSEELSAMLQSSNSDVLLAMKHLLVSPSGTKSPPKHNSGLSPKKNEPKQQQKMDTLFKKACERQKTPKNTPTKEARKSPWSNKKDADDSNGATGDSADSLDGAPSRNTRSSQEKMEIDQDDSPVKATKQAKAVKRDLSNKFSTSAPKPKKLNKDIFDDEDSSPEKSKEVKEESPDRDAEKLAAKRKRSPSCPPFTGPGKASEPAHDSEECQESTVSSTTELEVPAKKRKMFKTIETYKDEDGFLVTKEVLRMEETEEPAESHSKPLRPANNNKASHPPQPKKKSASTGTQKISAFFAKK
ncbi:hypothetical protein ANCCAN_26334, partial [Ancylostoma caninum]